MRLIELEAILASVEGKKKRLPAFVKENKPKPKEKKPRKKRSAKDNNGRRRETPTRCETHRLEACPTCRHELRKYKESYKRQIIDIPEPQPIEIVEHQVEKGWCESCRRWHEPEKKWAEAVGQGRMGICLTGLVGYMRSVLRLPYHQIQAFLQSVHRLWVSVGELVNLGRKVETHLEQQVNDLLQDARGSPHMHVDETG